MWKPRILAAAAIACLAGASAFAQTRSDPRQEDRAAGRQDERAAEARLAVPRNADGTIDTRVLLDAVRAEIARGAREIQFRDAGLTPDEARNLLLGTDRNLLAALSALLPKDGVERHIRLRGDVDARVQRNEDGELRARIEGINVGNLTATQRSELSRQLAARFGFDRVRIRGVDGDGDRIRIEFRDGRGVVKNEAREGREGGEGRREDRVARLEHKDKPERPERAEKIERPERAERGERAERVERAERSDRSGRH